MADNLIEVKRNTHKHSSLTVYYVFLRRKVIRSFTSAEDVGGHISALAYAEGVAYGIEDGDCTATITDEGE